MSTEPMRGLSIMHPWCAAIAYGTKTVENRTWGAPEWITGKTIAIHASKKPDISARPPDGEAWPERKMHLGAVIAVARVTGSCVPWECDGGCSPWAVRGQDHWHLTDRQALAEPVPCRGMLGLWRLPEDVEKLVRAQLSGG
jgi:hypothetical protein